ncbi:hypothetical protein [Dyadobacter sp. CY323]|uniref:hypothetical protein n=1 Tax=Dyadobacter sp. CY323 TaxID=2907302 RepID=UPI001F22BCF5|nr:hypothetical protein [Dyadobacter sp. CY323]MCE6992582.1 hypothetical protein [Dyadobacter sp. CY323]
MKKIARIGLLLLLLCNMFGLSLAILLFENEHQAATPAGEHDEWKIMKIYLPSLPYSGQVEFPQHMQALVRFQDRFYNPTSLSHQNDTLYVTLKSNLAARDHFFELAHAAQLLTDQQGSSQSKNGKIIKLLDGLAKNYVPGSAPFLFQRQLTGSYTPNITDFDIAISYTSIQGALTTPPPEYC